MRQQIIDFFIELYSVLGPVGGSLVIALAGIGIYGFRDVLRFSLGRIWAISGVCFRDAIRRRVLWITPLAMLAVIVISQLQNPVDEPDAIRQTIKFCYFTTAIVVTVIALITAATNLPREIENRVIFTIVTKPVTRLEIVLGKIVGFSRVSAAMLIIMGLFTIGYLHLRSWYFQSSMAQRLQDPNLDASSREWLQHFQSQGLLTARTISEPIQLTQYARIPDEKTGSWMLGGSQEAFVQFHLNSGDLYQGANPDAPPGSEKAYFFFDIKTEKIDIGRSTRQNAVPEVQIMIWDSKAEQVLFTSEQLVIKKESAKEENIHLATAALNGFARIVIPPKIAQQLEQKGDFFVQLVGESQGHLYQIDNKSVSIIVGNLEDPANATYGKKYDSIGTPILRGSQGYFTAQQLKGKEHGIEPVAIFSFKDATFADSTGNSVPFELKVAIDKNDSESNSPTTLAIQVKDPSTGKISPQTLVYPENRKTAFFNLPQDHITSSNFDVLVRCLSPGQSVELNRGTLQLIADHQPFALNLFKGLFILWTFAILVSTISFLTSTFLSWPIAVVLTIFIILGKWIVMNLDIGTGIGAQFAQEYFQGDTTASTVVNQTVETLTRALTLATMATPNIEPYGVTELVERGISISWSQVHDPLWILLIYGLPFITFSYVIMRNKEVAP